MILRTYNTIVCILFLFFIMGIQGLSTHAQENSAFTQQVFQFIHNPKNQAIAQWIPETESPENQCLAIKKVSFLPPPYTEGWWRGWQEATELVENDPTLVLPFLSSAKPPEILTLLSFFLQSPKIDLYRLNSAQQKKFSESLRISGLSNSDKRIRWASLILMSDHEWLSIQDVKNLLNDPSIEIRVAMAERLEKFVDSKTVYFMKGKKMRIHRRYKKSPLENFRRLLVPLNKKKEEEKKIENMKRLLIPSLLSHLQDSNPCIGKMILHSLKKWIGLHTIPNDPELAPWVEYPEKLPSLLNEEKNVVWETLNKEEQKENFQSLVQWWQKHGDSAIAFSMGR